MTQETERIRTRFAPSPTGFLHVGGVRTAIFAYLLAAQGKKDSSFILRIEDTDQSREVEGSDKHIIESLAALAIDHQEGPDIGGPHAPYIQSERHEQGVYKRYAEMLIAQGRAYADPYTTEEVQSFRDQAKVDKKPFLYRNFRPENPPEWDGTQPLRFKSDPKSYTWTDLIMGERSTGPETIDDFILIKSDGFPTYNFAHIIDDHEMEITDVIRGQEFLPSTPNFLNLYEALGLKVPNFASAPPVLTEDGKRKLSKRDGARDVLDYIREGYLPNALVNFIASLGWNDGSDQELFDRQKLIEKFSLSRVQKSGARFDEKRLLWMNGTYIREKMSPQELYEYSTGNNFIKKDYWPEESKQFDQDYKIKVLKLVQERLKYLDELPDLSIFFFKDLPLDPSLISQNKQLKKLSTDQIKSLLNQAEETLTQSDFSVEDLTTRLNELLETTEQKPSVLFSIIRIATTQAPASPGLADTMNVLGKEISLARLRKQIANL